MKIAADIIWTCGQTHLNRALQFENGFVKGVEDATDADKTFENHAIIPGFANAHSHSFQRAIRGKTEWLKPNQDDDFWSWRDAMYQTANRLSPSNIEAVAEWTFLEMLKAGITAVGEFHYLHHQRDGVPYENVSELSDRVIAAAQRVGIRLTHLPVAYARGGFEQPLVSHQRRFAFQNVDGYLDMVRQLQVRHAQSETISIGIAPHSVRAVDREWIAACEAAAHTWHSPFHIHVCEQIRELQECQAEYGQGPIELLADIGALREQTTLVHATHLTETDAKRIGQTRTLVCGCPTTESNLGDGFLPARQLLEWQTRICLGTDSHAQIDLFQEARLVEIQQRLQQQRRNVLAHYARPVDGLKKTSGSIWPMMNLHGYQSLGWAGGQLASGEPADFLVVDLEHPALLGVSHDDLLDTLILSGQNDAIKSVYVHGVPVIVDGCSHAEAGIRARYLQALKALRCA